MHRVDKLADREKPRKENFKSIIPLAELIAETLGRGVNTKGVQSVYLKLLEALGPEFGILLDVPVKDIEMAGGERLAGAVSKMRSGDIYISPGFDGEYGKVKIFGEEPEKTKKMSSKKKGKGRAPQGELF